MCFKGFLVGYNGGCMNGVPSIMAREIPIRSSGEQLVLLDAQPCFENLMSEGMRSTGLFRRPRVVFPRKGS